MRENLDVVRALVEAWNARDLDAMFGLTSPAIEYVNSPVAVEPGTRCGHAEYASVMQKQWDALGDAHIEIEAERASDDEVFMALTLRRSLEGSAATISARAGMRCALVDGLVVKQEILVPDDVGDA